MRSSACSCHAQSVWQADLRAPLPLDGGGAERRLEGRLPFFNGLPRLVFDLHADDQQPEERCNNADQSEIAVDEVRIAIKPAPITVGAISCARRPYMNTTIPTSTSEKRPDRSSQENKRDAVPVCRFHQTISIGNSEPGSDSIES